MYWEVWDADEHDHGKLELRLRGGAIINTIIKTKADKGKRSESKIEHEQ